jgi:hypothetical protein
MKNSNKTYFLIPPWKISTHKTKLVSEYKSNFVSVKKQLKLISQKSLKRIMT